MDHSFIDEQQVAERYLMGKLPPEEAARFEEHSLSCPECIERLEIAEKLRLGLHQVAVEETAGAAVQLGLLARLVRSRSAPWIVGLLLLAAVLPSGLLLREVGQLGRELERTREALVQRPPRTNPLPPNGTSPEDLEALRERTAALERVAEQNRRELDRLSADLTRARQPQANVPVVPLSPERSGPAAEPSTRVVLSSTTEWIVLSLELDGPDHPGYRATLAGPGGRTLWASSGLRPDSFGTLTVALHASQLAPGDFTVRVEGLPAQGEPAPVADFSFRVVREL